MKTARACIVASVLALLAAACGYKGPLTLPEKGGPVTIRPGAQPPATGTAPAGQAPAAGSAPAQATPATPGATQESPAAPTVKEPPKPPQPPPPAPQDPVPNG